jgi:hypothetical protein
MAKAGFTKYAEVTYRTKIKVLILKMKNYNITSIETVIKYS